MPLVLTALKGIPLIRQGDNLADIILIGLGALWLWGRELLQKRSTAAA